MYDSNRLLSDVFKMVGIRQKRKSDMFYKLIKNDFTVVLKQLQVVSSISNDRFQERVDRVWEKLLEIVLYVRTGQHRTLAQVLKAFVGGKVDHKKVTSEERSKLKSLFAFLRKLYTLPDMKDSKLVTDQPHFYTMVTTLHSLGGIEAPATMMKKIATVARMVDDKMSAPKGYGGKLKEYMELSSKQTTHPGRRTTRQELFTELLNSV